MGRDWIRVVAGGAGLLVGAAGATLWGWKRARLEELAAGSELVATDRGIVEVARRGSGYPVVVLHGAPGGYDQGLRLGEATFGDGFEVVAPSRPGYLRTPLAAGRSPDEQAALVVALLDELDVERALVVGLSAGGPTALQLAADYPGRVSGLVLGASVTTELDDRTYGTGVPLVDRLLTSAPALDVQSGLAAAYARIAPDSLLAQVHGSLSTLDGEALDDYVDFVRPTPGHRERFLAFVRTLSPASARIEGVDNDEYWQRRLPLVDYGTVECPALVVHGEFDALVPISHAESVVDRLPDAELVRVDADHLAWIGPDADRAGRRVRAFAESIAATAEPTDRVAD